MSAEKKLSHGLLPSKQWVEAATKGTNTRIPIGVRVMQETWPMEATAVLQKRKDDDHGLMAEKRLKWGRKSPVRSIHGVLPCPSQPLLDEHFPDCFQKAAGAKFPQLPQAIYSSASLVLHCQIFLNIKGKFFLLQFKMITSHTISRVHGEWFITFSFPATGTFYVFEGCLCVLPQPSPDKTIPLF